MQKKLIALAIAGLSSAAFAQSNVTVYGVVDLGQAFVKSTSSTAGVEGQASIGRLDSNSSHIGFKGSEALGNGLTAVFQYESGFTADTAGALSGARDTYIGLNGGFGTVLAGNLTHPLRSMGAKVDLLPGAAGFGTVASITGRIGAVNTGADDRANNAIAYVSPSFSGFSVIGAYVNGEVQPNGAGTGENKAYQIAGVYDNGPLYVGAGYHKADNILGDADADAKIWRLAATYNLPSNTKLTALYDNTKVNGAASGTWDKRTAWSVGAAQTFGASMIGLQYARSGNVKDETTTNADTRSRIVSLVYTYTLSKRTLVHARYSKLNNDANVATTFYNNPVAVPGAGSDSTGYMVGLRHSF